MKKNQKEQAEKLQAKLEKLLRSREKKQSTFVKPKKELSDLSQSIDSTKLKLFEILQNGSDDMAFSNWAKRKISENGNSENGKNENAKSENHANSNSAKSENATTPTTQNHNQHDKQNQHGKQNQQSQQPQNTPSHTEQNRNSPQS